VQAAGRNAGLPRDSNPRPTHYELSDLGPGGVHGRPENGLRAWSREGSGSSGRRWTPPDQEAIETTIETVTSADVAPTQSGRSVSVAWATATKAERLART
jgi:hypothetical protein